MVKLIKNTSIYCFPNFFLLFLNKKHQRHSRHYRSCSSSCRNSKWVPNENTHSSRQRSLAHSCWALVSLRTTKHNSSRSFNRPPTTPQPKWQPLVNEVITTFIPLPPTPTLIGAHDRLIPPHYHDHHGGDVLCRPSPGQRCTQTILQRNYTDRHPRVFNQVFNLNTSVEFDSRSESSHCPTIMM